MYRNVSLPRYVNIPSNSIYTKPHCVTINWQSDYPRPLQYCLQLQCHSVDWDMVSSLHCKSVSSLSDLGSFSVGISLVPQMWLSCVYDVQSIKAIWTICRGILHGLLQNYCFWLTVDPTKHCWFSLLDFLNGYGKPTGNASMWIKLVTI